MKRIMLLLALAGLLNGCAWFRHGDEGGSAPATTGPDSGPIRGTTGVSSGADAAAGTTGSDLAPR